MEGLTAEEALGVALSKIAAQSVGYDHYEQIDDTTVKIYFKTGDTVIFKLPTATVSEATIKQKVDEWLIEHEDELHGKDGKGVQILKEGETEDDISEETVLAFGLTEVESDEEPYTQMEADIRFALSKDVGDKTKLIVSTRKDLVEAINTVWLAGMGAYKFEVDEAKKQLTIVTRGGTEIPIDIAQIILNTNITEFKDMLVTSVLDGQSLVWSASKQKWINKSIDSSGMLVEAKKYTDDELKKINNRGRLAVDEKPTYYGGIITYVKGGETKTTDNTETWFYYYNEDAKATQITWIDGTPFEISMVGDINLDDYVAKEMLMHTYDENFVDKTKVPTTAYMEEFKGAIDEDLGGKVNVADVIDALNSDATDKPLSAKQGKVLADSKLNNTTDVENSGKALVVDASGKIVFGDAGVKVSAEDDNKIETKDDGIFVASEIDDESESEDSTWSSSKINANLTELNDSFVDKVPFKFGITEDGQYGYIKDGADTVTPFKSGDGATVLRGIMPGKSTDIFTTEKACKEITVSGGYSSDLFVIKVNGEDKTNLLSNYGVIVNGHGLSSATISGDFPIGTEISVQNKSTGAAGYVICY